VRVAFTQQGWEDYTSWVDQRKVLARVNRLIAEAHRSPGEGTGKPERLKANWAGYWSRRIDQEHRLVYSVEGDVITVVACRYHY
jgi:toxin YoeB